MIVKLSDNLNDLEQRNNSNSRTIVSFKRIKDIWIFFFWNWEMSLWNNSSNNLIILMSRISTTSKTSYLNSNWGIRYYVKPSKFIIKRQLTTSYYFLTLVSEKKKSIFKCFYFHELNRHRYRYQAKKSHFLHTIKIITFRICSESFECLPLFKFKTSFLSYNFSVRVEKT